MARFCLPPPAPTLLNLWAAATAVAARDVDLFNMDLGDPGAVAIAKVVDSNASLECLTMERNGITGEGGEALIRSLGPNMGIKVALSPTSLSSSLYSLSLSTLFSLNYLAPGISFTSIPPILPRPLKRVRNV